MSALGVEEDGAEHEDLYQTLKVSKDAHEVDLRASFRRLSQRYHPDKHIDEEAKASATDLFTKVKEAYEILSNKKLRRIYNEFGLEAARSAAMPGMDLIPYSDLAERFRNDAAGAAGPGGANASRDAYFTVVNSLEPRVDATGLVAAIEDGDVLTAGNLAIFTQVGVATMATAYVSQKNTLSMRYSLSGQATQFAQRATPGVGDVALSLRHQVDQYTQAEGSIYSPLDNSRPMSYGFKAHRALSNHMTGSFEATYDPERRDLTTALTYSRIFDERSTASVSWAYGGVPGYAFTWRSSAYDEYLPESRSSKVQEDQMYASDDEDTVQAQGGGRIAWIIQRLTNFIKPMGWRCTARWSLVDPALSLVLRRPVGENFPLWTRCEAGEPGASVKIRGQLGLMGWEVEVGGGRKYVIADTAWATSVGFGTMGVVWRVKISRGGHRFILPVVLHSSVADPKTATVAAVSTSLLVSAMQMLVIGPWQARKDEEERAEAKERRKPVLEQGLLEAEASIMLMKQAVEGSRKQEMNVTINGRRGCGLLIERAVYGVEKSVRKMKFSDASLKGQEIECEAAEVTEGVQILVAGSAIQVVSTTKSTLTGFWDPSAYGYKEELVLRIWYLFKGEKHECMIRDNRPIEIPLSGHKISNWT